MPSYDALAASMIFECADLIWQMNEHQICLGKTRVQDFLISSAGCGSRQCLWLAGNCL